MEGGTRVKTDRRRCAGRWLRKFHFCVCCPEPSECHAFLDPTEEGDADEVKGSDATYEFAAINPRVEEGELYLKCFTCHCQMCRQPTSVNTEFRQCPNLIQTGGWRRVPCHRTRGFVQRASKKRDDVVDFAQNMAVGSLYASAADPKNLDRGGRPYWLFRTAGKARKLTAKVRAFEHPKAPIHKVGTWVVGAQWYLNTALHALDKRQSYKLLP